MKNLTILILVFILIMGGASLLWINEKNPSSNTNLTNSGQEVVLSMKNYNYYPNIIEVEADKRVSITLDNSVRGCYRSFNIPELGVSKTSANSDDKIIFTPSKKGTFRFACSMGMGTGTIIVK